MARLNVSVPDDLAALVRDELAGVNVSRVLQLALRSLLACRHAIFECQRCGVAIERAEVEDQALSAFYRDALHELGQLMIAGGTVEGSARVLRSVAQHHAVSAAASTPLPRLTRAERESRAADVA